MALTVAYAVDLWKLLSKAVTTAPVLAMFSVKLHSCIFTITVRLLADSFSTRTAQTNLSKLQSLIVSISDSVGSRNVKSGFPIATNFKYNHFMPPF